MDYFFLHTECPILDEMHLLPESVRIMEKDKEQKLVSKTFPMGPSVLTHGNNGDSTELIYLGQPAFVLRITQTML